ncbi:MAG: response regulator [Blautia sp.]|nr:response regulator [Blautia sp.]
MLRIALIDDEKIVLKGIAAAIRKEGSYELAGTAENGLDGLALIKEQHPDIIMTDIRMPGMSGLELIRESKKLLPDAVYIVFSGFQEFKYVKEAIGLGVIDYLEKPVTMPKLREVLKKAGDLYQYKEKYASMSEDLQKADHAWIENMLRELYEHPEDEERLLGQIRQKASTLEHARSLCAVQVSGKNAQSIEDMRSIVQALTLDICEKEPVEVYTFYRQDSLMIAYFNMGQMEFPFVSRLSGQKKKLDQEELPAFAGISRIHKNFYEIRTMLEEAQRAHRYAAYLEAEELVCFDAVEYTSEIPQQPGKDHKSLEFSFRIGEYDACRNQIQEYLQYLLKLELVPEILIQKCLELIFQLQRLIRDAGIETTGKETAYAQVKELVSGEQIARWTREQTDQLLEEAQSASDKGTSKAVRMVKQYVEKHYGEGISLDELAQEVHMSSTYLSMLFKKEEGLTYIRYLTKVRMEKAMAFLKEGYKAKDVCEMVGYHDYKHFSTQFKSSTGMTLENFKKSL